MDEISEFARWNGDHLAELAYDSVSNRRICQAAEMNLTIVFFVLNTASS